MSDGELGDDLEAGLAELPPERLAALRDAALLFAAMAPEEQAQVRAAAEREMLDHQAEQVTDAALDALRRGRVLAILPRLAEGACSFSAGQAPDSPRAGLASFIEAVAALLRDDTAPPVPAEYAERLASFERELKAIRSLRWPGPSDAAQAAG